MRVRSAVILHLLMIFALCPSVSPLLAAGSRLVFPRASFDLNLPLGVAIVNPAAQDADVTITAYGIDGQPLTCKGITNPVQMKVGAYHQEARIASDLFGTCIDPSTIAWLEGTSPADGLTGFYLLFSPLPAFLEGTDLPVPSQKLIFNLVRIDGGFSTEIDLVNPESVAAELQIQLAGISPAPVIKQLSIPGKAVVRLDVATFFQVKDISAGAYVSVDANVEVAGFELVNGAADGTGLNGRSVSEKLSSLYFLQLSVLGSRRSRLGVINYSSEPAVLTISALKPDGTLYDFTSLKDNPVTRALPAGGSLSEDVESMFGFSGDLPLDGWLTVKATSAAINGYLTYTDESSGAEAILTSTAQGRLRSLFSHIATTAPYHTDLALLNPGSLSANLRVVALERSGKVLGSYDTVIQPGQRFNKRLGSTDFIPAAAGQSGGFIWVKSDLPLYVSSVIGDDVSYTNVPPQEVSESYNPDADLSSLKLIPPIAVVPPGSSQRFQVSGGSTSAWYVNGAAGGTAATGTISSAGVYTSPKSVPERQVVTITAEANNQSAGASADILTKSVFTKGLSVVQSVAYLGSLRKVYLSELSALSSGSTPPMAPGAAAEGDISRISEVAPSLPAVPLFTYSGENIVKILGFTASDGKEYLLLLGQTSGRLIRLNPLTKESLDVVTGLNRPASMVLDPISGDLLVVEQDKITTVPKATLESGLNLPAPTGWSENLEALLRHFPAVEFSGAAGIAVDRCTGKIYLSFPETGSIVEFDPLTGSSRSVVTNLLNPGQLLGLYRTGVTCPDAFHLLVVERDAGRVDLVVPSSGSVTVWLESTGIRDLTFMPAGSPFTSEEGVLLADYTLENHGEVFIVPMIELYDSKTANPPVTAFIDRRTDLIVSQSSSPHEAAPGAVITYRAAVRNNGPLTATEVILLDALPSAATLKSASSSQGDCLSAGAGILCRIGSLALNGEVTVTISASINGKTPPGTITNAIDVSATEVDPDPSNNHSIETTTVLSATASGFRISGPTAPVGSGEPFGIVVTAVDTTGNVIPDYTGRVHFTSTDVEASLPRDYTFAAADGGSHAFDGLRLLTGGTQTVTVAEAVTAASLSGIITVEVKAGTASTVEPAGLAPRTAAGTPQNLTVSLRDSNGNLADSFVGWVSLSSSDPQAVLPSGRFLTSTDGGRYTFSGIILKTAGTQTVTITATPGSSQPQAAKGDRAAHQASTSIITKVVSVEVTPAPASSLVISPGTTTATAGVAFDLSVTAKDDFGNTATGYTGTVSATSTDPQATRLVSGYTFSTGAAADNGIHTFSIILRTAGSTTITVADSGANAISGTSSPITVVPGPLDHITLSPAASTITTDGSQAYSVTAYDADSNSRGDVTASTTFTIATGGTCTGASCTSTVASPTPYTVTATYSGRSAQAALTVEAGALHHIGLSPATASISAGGTQTYLATGFDQYNNSRGDVTGTTTFSITPNGSCTLNDCTATVAGSHTVTGTTEGKTGNASLTVVPGAAVQLFVSAPGSATAGTAISISVTAMDAYNNTATGYPGTVHFTSSDALATLPPNATLVSGVGSFPVTFNDICGQTQTVSASDTVTPSLSVTSGSISVSPSFTAGDGYSNISNVSINGGGNMVTLQAGAVFRATMDYWIQNPTYCPGCVQQIQIGYSHLSSVQGCIYNGIPSLSPGTSGSASMSFTAPAAPGCYIIGFGRSFQFSCLPYWASGPPVTPSGFIARIIVQ